jgi:spermidine synthase
MKPAVRKITSLPHLVLLVVLLLSGISALINQIVWIRKFGLVFGVDVYTMGTVLSAFMGGLALGSLFFGRLADKSRNPLRLFIILELGIGLFAVLFPFTFRGLVHSYTYAIGISGLAGKGEQFIKFSFSFVYLLIPTTLMGGTLPVAFKFFVKELRTLGWNISRLYSVNNLGAVIGCGLAGFVLIKFLGLTSALYIGACLNLINAGIVFWVSTARKKEDPSAVTYVESSGSMPGAENILPGPLLRMVLWVFVIEGFATLAYEVLWARIFIGFSYDKTTYFTSVIVLSFIFGLSLGSYIISGWIDRRKDLVTLLAVLEIMIGLSSLALLMLFSRISLYLNLQRSMFDSWLRIMGKEYFIFFALLVIPNTLTGMVYPVVSKLYARNIGMLGKRMGTIGFLDTAGSILGSFAAGFLMIPALGVVKSFLAVVLLNLALGALLILFNRNLSSKYRIALLTSLLALSGFMILKAPKTEYFSWWDKSRAEIWSNFVENVPFYDEGPDATVSIREYNNYYSLNINGHNTAYTTMKDQIANRMLGYIPYMLHRKPKKAMVVGFGLGFTVESLIQPEIDTVEVAEICKGVIISGHRLNTWNNNVIDNPKVHVHLEDGRGYLFRTPSRFDIITSNAIHPRLSNNIYTRDFYEVCRDKLNPGGIMCQWATPNWLTETEYKAQVKAFIEVFKYCQLWYLNEYSTILIGSEEPIIIDYDLISRRFMDPKVQEDLKNVNMRDPLIFTSQYSMGKEELTKYCEGAPANTDDFPVVEFSTIVNIAPDTSALKFFRANRIDYNAISFSDTMSIKEIDKIQSKMQFYSSIRNHIIDDLVLEVKRQVGEFNSARSEK